ncbi:MAG: accessory gene regulator B family protein [Eubacterium sp.]|nr:accessory gene regulator B family protein [Eubacterium sp.]
MINKLSKVFTDKLLVNGTITEEQQELYIYGFFMLLSQLMYLILACIFGLTLGCAFESIIFYIAFQFIRRYSGGYHASTETRCEILSILSILACIIVIRLSRTYDIQTVLLVISAASAVCIFCLSPLDTPEKPLSDKEFKYFRKISWLILLVIVVAIIVSYIFKFQIITVPCCLSLILESILLVTGIIKRMSQKNNVKT